MAARKGNGFASRTQPNAAQKQSSPHVRENPHPQKPRVGHPQRASPRRVPLSAKERRKFEDVVRKKNEKLRKKYRAVHGKVVDWVDHAFEDGDLFVSIRFQDKTDFGLVFRPKIVTDDISLYDVRTGNFRLVRQYFRRRGD